MSNPNLTYIQGASFGDVVDRLPLGYKARREAWGEGGPFVVCDENDHVDVRIWLTGHALSVAWTPDWSSIFSNDWIIYKSKEAMK